MKSESSTEISSQTISLSEVLNQPKIISISLILVSLNAIKTLRVSIFHSERAKILLELLVMLQ
jgi:hypothetical protein